MKLSEIVTKLEEWLNEFSYDYVINSIIPDARYKYKISATEIGPDGNESNVFYVLFVDENGDIYNTNGDNVVEAAQEAYFYDEEILEWLMKFEEKWRIK